VDEKIKQNLVNFYNKTILNSNQQSKVNSTNFQNNLRKLIRKKIFKLTDKEPMIVVSFNEI
ncbi:MAG: hypothetical protein IJ970_01935, partial [Mycoplasmataceae bacterium]|nr:hypothetical protein [Mycoplasmataceae bacterium]